MLTDNSIYQVTFQDAVDLHESILAASSGRSGILSESAILSAIGRPYCGYFNTMPEMASALMEAIVQNHGFVDGNKRTAVMLTYLFIRRSGFDLLSVSETDDIGQSLEDMVVNLAAGHIERDWVTGWFNTHCLPK